VVSECPHRALRYRSILLRRAASTVQRMDVLPRWPEGTVAVLATGERHQIPVSLVHRAGDRALVVGLAPSRESLANLRAEPRCAVTVIAPGIAFTAHGRATVEDAGPIAGVRVDVEGIADHTQDTFEITAGVRWRWTDEEAARRDADARHALRRLAT
jgi:hypothetical protein